MGEESPLGKQPELKEKYLPRRKWDKKKQPKIVKRVECLEPFPSAHLAFLITPLSKYCSHLYTSKTATNTLLFYNSCSLIDI